MPAPREPATEGGDDGGMMDLEAFQRLQAEEDANRPPPPPVDPDALPSVSDLRRRELKEQARQMIDERLRARRKQRRLMRGGDV